MFSFVVINVQITNPLRTNVVSLFTEITLPRSHIKTNLK